MRISTSKYTRSPEKSFSQWDGSILRNCDHLVGKSVFESITATRLSYTVGKISLDRFSGVKSMFFEQHFYFRGQPIVEETYINSVRRFIVRWCTRLWFVIYCCTSFDACASARYSLTRTRTVLFTQNFLYYIIIFRYNMNMYCFFYKELFNFKNLTII